MAELTVGVVQGWMTRPNGSLAVTIPHRLREEQGLKGGVRFVVKTDDRGRVIYEPQEV